MKFIPRSWNAKPGQSLRFRRGQANTRHSSGIISVLAGSTILKLGNFDYLMGANVDFRNKAVSEELKYWARWVMEQVPCTGFRLDAVKHIPAWFYKDWIEHIQDVANEPLFIAAEYWSFETEKLQEYINQVEGKTLLFDAPLHMNFHQASKAGSDYDLSKIFDNSLVLADPWHAVTIVANHDTQPLQSLEAPVEAWFKPLAYALILLREQGVPTIFYPDLFGAHYEDEGGDGEMHQVDMPVIPELEGLIRARQQFGWGAQTDYFDHPNCVAFSRSGTAEKPGCIVIMSNGEAGKNRFQWEKDMPGKYGMTIWDINPIPLRRTTPAAPCFAVMQAA